MLGGNLFRVWYKVEVVGMHAVAVDEIPKFETSVIVIAAEDSARIVVNRYVMKKLISVETNPILVYRKLVSKCVVAEFVGVLIGITVQLSYIRTVTLARVHKTNQRFRHVG